jgi:hypothetical protein
MKNGATLSILLFAFLTGSSQTNTSVINASGGFATAGYYQFEWSIGEMSLVNELESPGKLIVTNGFLQPYFLTPGTINLLSQFGMEEIKVFPNPASSYVEINFFTKQRGRIKMELLNEIGQRVYSQETISYGVDLIWRIPVNQLTNGAYLVNIKLSAERGFVSKAGSYKILKIK